MASLLCRPIRMGAVKALVRAVGVRAKASPVRRNPVLLMRGGKGRRCFHQGAWCCTPVATSEARCAGGNATSHDASGDQPREEGGAGGSQDDASKANQFTDPKVPILREALALVPQYGYGLALTAGSRSFSLTHVVCMLVGCQLDRGMLVGGCTASRVRGGLALA